MGTSRKLDIRIGEELEARIKDAAGLEGLDVSKWIRKVAEAAAADTLGAYVDRLNEVKGITVLRRSATHEEKAMSIAGWFTRHVGKRVEILICAVPGMELHMRIITTQLDHFEAEVDEYSGRRWRFPYAQVLRFAALPE